MTISSSSCGIWKINEVYNKVRGNYWPQDNAQTSYLAETYFTGNNKSGIDGSNSPIDSQLKFEAKCSATCWVLARVATTAYAGVDVGKAYAARIRCDGTLWMTGENLYGQLGQNNRTHASSPVQVPGTNWCDVHISNALTLAVKTDGTLWSWGRNTFGELGKIDRIHRSSPVQIPGTNWCGVSGGLKHVLGIKKNGELYSWGCNAEGSSLGLGNVFGGIVHRSSPVQIPGTSWFKLMNSGCTSSSFAFKLPLPF
jgi:alpha-tubulin suppressor-like RCC1 family protein